jgi:protein gp37
MDDMIIHKPWSVPFGDQQLMAPIGKKAAGRLLDGRTWDEVPS